ncbi:GNAT family N-acetyltransferase [Halobaculum sp. CBA1158]|uniref:GNAT family N-acetyltransferase n=1 Tax=Halobaculum sp. CBA1158 TaxID=2904243 RepID=UPI001F1FE61F|nr:N-acetyltransferase [Halobaculum sp. CBA1158]UIO98603.1 GNAT family N-acetyltransferase [Halobaculum sp. CBA1158]
MSVNVEKRVDPPGDATHVEAAWALKEEIREADGVLKQRRGFFTDAYRRATCHLLVEDDELVAFAATRRDGYVLFLAVAPDARGRGHGERLVAEVAEDSRSVSCHARTTNEEALAFYEHIGFDVVRRIDGYYEDGGDAYYLKLGDDASLTDRLSKFLR